MTSPWVMANSVLCGGQRWPWLSMADWHPAGPERSPRTPRDGRRAPLSTTFRRCENRHQAVGQLGVVDEGVAVALPLEDGDVAVPLPLRDRLLLVPGQQHLLPLRRHLVGLDHAGIAQEEVED